MGLLKVAISAVNSTLQDQWKKAIRCEDMGNEMLMKRITPPNGVISNKSMIIVAPGQMAIIYDNGRVLDATAEEGMYLFDTSSTPTFFAGQFGAVFDQMWDRFTFGGERARTQSVFYFNMKEIIDNKFGTPAPIPYRDFEHPIMNARTGTYLPMRVEMKCFGSYTFQIVDPRLFMERIVGSAEQYSKSDIVDQMRSEVIAALTNVLNGLGSEEHRVGALALPGKSLEMKKIMEEQVYDQGIRDRGMKLTGFVIESVTLDDASNQKIDVYEMGGDAYQQKAKLVDSYGNAIQNAANNSNGVMNTFMGMGMMNNVMGAGINGDTGVKMAEGPPMQAYQMDDPQAQGAKKVAKACCLNCNQEVTGKFCSNCGTPAPVPVARYCSECGTNVTGNFCTNCGMKV